MKTRRLYSNLILIVYGAKWITAYVNFLSVVG